MGSTIDTMRYSFFRRKFRGIAAFFLAAFLAGGYSPPAFGQSPASHQVGPIWAASDGLRFDAIDMSAEEKQFLRDHPKIRVAIANEDYAPLQYIDKSGRISGMSVDVLRAIGSLLGIEMVPVVYERWDDVLTAVKERKADVIPYAGYSSERDEYLDFTLGVARAPGGLMALRDERSVDANPLLSGVKIGVGKGYLSEKWVKVLFPDSHAVALDSIDDVIAALQSRRVQYYLGPALDTLAAAERVGMPDLEFKKQLYFGSGWAHVAVRSDWQIFTNLVNRIVGDGREKLPNFTQEIEASTGRPAAPVVALDSAQARLISDIGVLRVGAVRGLYSLNDIDADGIHLGIAAEYTAMISDRLGVAVKVVSFESVAEMIEAAENGQIDMIPLFTKTKERLKTFSFSEPYVEMPYVLLGKSDGRLFWDLGSLEGKRLALARKHPLIPVVKERFTKITLIETLNGQHAIQMVANGQADAGVEVKLFANQFINGIYAGQVRILAQIDALPASFSMAVPKRLAQLVPLLDAGLTSITTSERESALRRWVAVDLEPVRNLRRYVRWLAIVAALLGLVTVMTVFWSRRVSAQSKLRQEAEQRLVDMTDRLRTGVYQYRRTADGKWIREFMNAVCRRMSRVEDGDPVDDRVKFFDFVHRDDQGHINKALATSFNCGTPFRESYRFKSPDGSWGWILAEASVRPGDNGSELWSGYFFDLTSERELNESLNSALLAKDEFLSMAGHELRAPVQAVKLAQEVLRQEDLTTERRTELLNQARQTTLHLEELVNDLLDLSQANANSLALSPTKIDFSLLLREICAIYELSVSEKGLAYEFDIADDIPEHVFADPVRLKQIIINLLSNAVKFTDTGYVRLKVWRADQTSKSSANDAKTDQSHTVPIRLSVQDSGIGIPEDRLNECFEPFNTVAPANRGSTGLGLAVCKRIVTQMNGQIWAESDQHQGTTFFVEIPLVLAEPSGLGQIETRSELVEDPVARESYSRPRKLLLVDDDRFAVSLLASLMSRRNFEVDQTTDAADALDRIAETQYDAVVSDITMPGMSGVELTEKIRLQVRPADKFVPLMVCVTGGMAPADTRKAAECFDVVLRKPISAVELEKILRQRLSKADSLSTST